MHQILNVETGKGCRMAREWSERHIRELIAKYGGGGGSSTVDFDFRMQVYTLYDLFVQGYNPQLSRFLLLNDITPLLLLYNSITFGPMISNDGRKLYPFSNVYSHVNMTIRTDAGKWAFRERNLFGYNSADGARYDCYEGAAELSGGTNGKDIFWRISEVYDFNERKAMWAEFESSHEPLGTLHVAQSMIPTVYKSGENTVATSPAMSVNGVNYYKNKYGIIPSFAYTQYFEEKHNFGSTALSPYIILKTVSS